MFTRNDPHQLIPEDIRRAAPGRRAVGAVHCARFAGVVLAAVVVLALPGVVSAGAPATDIAGASDEAGAAAMATSPTTPHATIDPIADRLVADGDVGLHPADSAPDPGVEHGWLGSLDGAIAAAHGRRVVRRRRVSTYHTHPRRRVVVVSRGRDNPGGKVLALPPREPVLSAGLRFTAVSLGDATIGNETFHGVTLGGIGGYIRGRFHDHFGLEFSTDVMGNFDGEYDQLTIPVLAGFMAHLLPSSKLDIYGVIGGGVLINAIDYNSVELKGGGTRSFSESYLQLAGHAGGGVELDIGALELVTDVRYLLLQARPERSAELKEAVPFEAGGDEDDVTHAVQFMIGIGGNFM